MKVFSERLIQLRKERGLSQATVARDLNVSLGIICYWETNKSDPTASNIAKIARYFNVTTDYLLGKTEDPGPVNGDEELTEYLEELRNRPEKRMLFSVTKNATKAQIEAIVRMIEEMQQQG